MANRFPLIIDSSTNRIVELPATDNLDLSGSNISSVANITSTANVTASYFLGNGSQLTGVLINPGGANTQVQFNNNGSFGGISTVTWNGSNLSLGAVGNVKLTGGTTGQVIQTDGAGNLSFTSISGTSISNGTSNVNIATSGGNVTVGVGGTANTVVFASTTTTVNTPIRTANTVIIGNLSGNTSVATTRGDVAIGYQAGGGSQSGDPTTAIGFQVGNTQQSQGAVAIGFKSGRSQGDAALAIGYQAGESQSPYAVAIGLFAGQTSQQTSGLAIGNQAGKSSQGLNAVALGTNAGIASQGANSIAIGTNAGPTSMFANSISIGTNSYVSTSAPSIAIGPGANANGQYTVVLGDTAKAGGNFAISIGSQAGGYSVGGSGPGSIAIGQAAGYSTMGANSISIGTSAGEQSQNAYSVAVGFKAGVNNQGANSIAIGANAGFLNQANNTIILNATGANLNMTTANTFTVKPVRNASAGNVLYYDNSTGEITYSTASASTRDYLFAYNAGTTVSLSSANASLTMDTIGSNTANVTYNTTTGNLLIPTGKLMRLSAAGLSYLIPGQASSQSSDVIWVYAANNVPLVGGVYTSIKGSDLTSGSSTSSTGGYSLELVINMGASANIKLVSRNAMTGVSFTNGQLVVTEV